jgi:hypothetical protein
VGPIDLGDLIFGKQEQVELMMPHMNTQVYPDYSLKQNDKVVSRAAYHLNRDIDENSKENLHFTRPISQDAYTRRKKPDGSSSLVRK